MSTVAAGLFIVATCVWGGCSTPRTIPPPISVSSGGGPFVFPSAQYTLTEDKELNSYPPVQHLINGLPVLNDTPSRVVSVFLPTDNVAPGTFLILICDNSPHNRVFFRVYFDRSDHPQVKGMLGQQTHLLMFGFDHKWQQFELE
jgi:hypothetical protein